MDYQKTAKRCISNFLDLIYPKFCGICSLKIKTETESGIHKDCFEKIKAKSLPLCSICGSKTEALKETQSNCRHCKESYFYFNRALSVYDYAPKIKTCIQIFKYKRNQHIGELLADKMIVFINNHYPMAELDLVAAIPLHRSKQNLRGFNQSNFLAQRIAAAFNKPLSNGNLIRHKKTNSQYCLNREQRIKNIKNAFSCKNSAEFKNKKLLLVDDIYTTGTTLNECAKIMKNAGAQKIIVFTLAKS